MFDVFDRLCLFGSNSTVIWNVTLKYSSVWTQWSLKKFQSNGYKMRRQNINWKYYHNQRKCSFNSKPQHGFCLNTIKHVYSCTEAAFYFWRVCGITVRLWCIWGYRSVRVFDKSLFQYTGTLNPMTCMEIHVWNILGLL